MAMPTDISTQSISFLQKQTEFGGSTPISLGEYYRKSAFAPAIYVEAKKYFVYYDTATATKSYVLAANPDGSGGASQAWYMDGTVVWSGSGNVTGVGTLLAGGEKYKLGSLIGSDPQPKVPGVSLAHDLYVYSIQRQESVNQSVPINTYVTVDGVVQLGYLPISMSNFYGTGN